MHIEVYKKEIFPSSRNYLGERAQCKLLRHWSPGEMHIGTVSLHICTLHTHASEGVCQATVTFCGLCINMLHLQSKECTERTTAIPNTSHIVFMCDKQGSKDKINTYIKSTICIAKYQIYM